MTNEDRQEFLSTLPEFYQATNTNPEDVYQILGRIALEKAILEKQITILLDRLIETSHANESLRETLSTLQQKSPTPQKT